MHELEVIDQLNESIKNYKTFINTENNSSNISECIYQNLKEIRLEKRRVIK